MRCFRALLRIEMGNVVVKDLPKQDLLKLLDLC